MNQPIPRLPVFYVQSVTVPKIIGYKDPVTEIDIEIGEEQIRQILEIISERKDDWNKNIRLRLKGHLIL